MERGRVVRFDELDRLDHGTGVSSRLLVHDGIGSDDLTTGISTFAPGAAIASHWHNCDESVVVLAGEATAEIDGELSELGERDATFVCAGVSHRFMNRSDAPMTILWIYAAGKVTRTFAATGMTVDHLEVASAPRPSRARDRGGVDVVDERGATLSGRSNP